MSGNIFKAKAVFLLFFQFLFLLRLYFNSAYADIRQAYCYFLQYLLRLNRHNNTSYLQQLLLSGEDRWERVIFLIQEPKQPQWNFRTAASFNSVRCDKGIFQTLYLLSCFAFSATFNCIFAVYKEITCI